MRVENARDLLPGDIRTMIANRLAEFNGAGTMTDFEELPSAVNKISPTEAAEMADAARLDALIEDYGWQRLAGATDGPTRPQFEGGVPWPGAVAQGDQARMAQLLGEVDALKALEDALESGTDPKIAVSRVLADAGSLYGAADPNMQAYVDMARWVDAFSDATGLGRNQAELDIYMLVRAELLSGRDPRRAVQAVMDVSDQGSDAWIAAQTVLGNLNGPAFDFVGRVPEGMQTEDLRQAWRARMDDLRGAAAAIDTSTPEGAERAAALKDAANKLFTASQDLRAGRDPRNKLQDHLRVLADRTFLDGLDGGGEASVLRSAIAEYADLLEEFRSGAAAMSGLDEGASPTAVAGVGRLVGDTPIDPSPPYPGLPDEYGADIRLTIDPPRYSEVFPGGMPDDVRRLLDLRPEQAGDGAEDIAGGWLRTIEVANLRNAPSAEDVPFTPQLDELGARWTLGDDAAALDEPSAAADLARGDYQAVNDIGGTAGPTVAVAPDTRAVIDGMPTAPLPDDFDWVSAMDTMNQRYLGFRRDSNWRAAIAYTDGLEAMRADMARAVADFGGDLDQVGRQFEDMYGALEALLGDAMDAGEVARVQRIGEFLETLEVRTYDLMTDLANRADEFEAVASGTVQPLDPHIDRAKLLDWVTGEFDDAMRRSTEVTDPDTMQEMSHRVTYFQQMMGALEDGRNPLTESGDQIAYLRATGAHEQAAVYAKYHDELVGVMSDPAFHRSAGTMGADTYAPVHFLRPELAGTRAPGLDAGVSTSVFDASASPGGGATTIGDYGANAEAINGLIGDADFGRVPDEVPEGLDPVPPGSGGILRHGDAGAVDLDESRLVNRGPEGEDISEMSTRVWVQRTLDEANAEALRSQGGFGNYMDEMARLNPSLIDDTTSMNPYAASRVDAANQLWDAQRTHDLRPPSEWDRWPSRGGMRSWDGGRRGRKSVRFGDASVMSVLADQDDVRRVTDQWRDVDAGNAAMPWWTGSGINRAADPVKADAAVRHVPTPRMPGDGQGYPSSWRATRQPGFGRLAEVPGGLPLQPAGAGARGHHAGQEAGRGAPDRHAGCDERRRVGEPGPAQRMAEHVGAAAQPALSRGARYRAAVR